MNTIRKFIYLIKRNVVKFNRFLMSTSLMTWSIPLSLFSIMLLPCISVSQQDTSRQAMIEHFQKLLNGSNIIVDAQVISKESKWDHSKGIRGMYTSIKFKVFQMIKGNVDGNEFIFDQPGGTLEGHTITVTTSLRYDLNERAIYFFENKKLSGYLMEYHRDVIHNGKVWVEDEYIDADLYVKVLKKSLKDSLVISKFVNMLKVMKEGSEATGIPANKPVLIPNPLDDTKYTAADSIRWKQMIERERLQRISKSHEIIRDTVKPENNKSTQGDVK